MNVPNRDEGAELRHRIVVRLVAELSAYDRREGITSSLEQAIDEFASICRANGDSAERVLLTLKAIITEAEAARLDPARADRADRRRVSETLIALCIQCYYRDRRP